MMKRYDVTTAWNNGVMEEDPDGEYVKFEDVISMLKEINSGMVDEAVAAEDKIEELER